MTKMFFTVALAFLAGAGRAADTPTWAGNPLLGAAELEAQWPLIADPQQVLPIRGTIRIALEAVGLGWHPERIAAALGRVRLMQDLERKSATFGNFKWRSDQPRVLDLNAVEFASQILGLMHRRYGSQLTPDARRQLEELMTDAIDGLRSHRVRVEYTNIFVMKAWGLIAAGEALQRPDVAADGYGRFDEWLRFTARHGIGEYGAVTYYGIDLDSLVLIAKFAGRASARDDAQAAIRYLWTDIAANWWAAGDRLGGANARSYDYLFGRGYLEAHTWTAGWLRERPQLEGAGWLAGVRENLSVVREAMTFVPPPEWTAPIRAQVPRMVVQRWGAGPENLATHWIGRRVSLAASGASRGSDERTLVANLGDSPAVPQLVLFMDGRGDPYGARRTANAAGQAKALHLTPFVATVQRGAELVQLLADEPFGPKSRYKPGELACFLTHLAIPAEAEVWLGETRTQPGTPENPMPVAPGLPVYVRIGDAAIAVRFVLAATVDGAAAPVQFIADGRRSVARRLTVVHSAAPKEGRGLVAVWMRAAEGLDDARFAAWRKAFATAQADARIAGDVCRINVAGEKGALTIEADLVKRERLVLAGGEPDALLSVNGRDLGRELLAGFRR
jgi:hypothetical protein